MTKKCHKILRRIGACSLAASVTISAATVEAKGIVTLFAASSLAPTLEIMIKPFSQDTGLRVRISAAASSVLARQIASGAPADIIVLANPAWMQWLEQRNLINQESRRDLVSNRLALLRHQDTSLPNELESALKQALKTGRIAMADPDHVPAGIYGKAALEGLGLWPEMAPYLARSPNAPATVALLSRGEVSAAISYQTDAHLSEKVVVHTIFPAKLHPPVRYQIATISTSAGPASNKLFNYLGHPDRLAIFMAAGFTAPVAP
jgi:molybdate transport system substrate-binding protein